MDATMLDTSQESVEAHVDEIDQRVEDLNIQGEGSEEGEIREPMEELANDPQPQPGPSGQQSTPETTNPSINNPGPYTAPAVLVQLSSRPAGPILDPQLIAPGPVQANGEPTPVHANGDQRDAQHADSGPGTAPVGPNQRQIPSQQGANHYAPKAAPAATNHRQNPHPQGSQAPTTGTTPAANIHQQNLAMPNQARHGNHRQAARARPRPLMAGLHRVQGQPPVRQGRQGQRPPPLMGLNRAHGGYVQGRQRSRNSQRNGAPLHVLTGQCLANIARLV